MSNAYYDDYDIVLDPSKISQSASGYVPSASDYYDSYSTSPSSYTAYGVGDDSWRPGGSSFLDLLSSAAGGIKSGASDLAKMMLTTPRGIGTLLAMIYGARNARPDMGGGVALKLSPAKVTRTVVPAKYGPVMKTEYAADGGLMQAYAMGGMVTGTPRRPMQMEDGGFVMTKAAVDGAGGPQGLAQSVPGSQLIVGPGDGSGKDDRVHAKIGNTTPARVSAGEMYVPKAAVDRAGGAKTLYALMNQLQRRA